MEGYLWLYIFLLAELPWWWRINHPSCLFPEWCSAVLLNTTASLNLNVRSPSAAAQDKANQHQMPPRWTYCLALESLTLTLLLINIIQPNPRVHFSQTTAKPSLGLGASSEAPCRRRGGGRQPAYGRRNERMPRRVAEWEPSSQPASLQCQHYLGAIDSSSHTKIHPQGIMEIDLEWDLPDTLEDSTGPNSQAKWQAVSQLPSPVHTLCPHQYIHSALTSTYTLP
jgi:hypothetical protein